MTSRSSRRATRSTWRARRHRARRNSTARGRRDRRDVTMLCVHLFSPCRLLRNLCATVVNLQRYLRLCPLVARCCSTILANLGLTNGRTCDIVAALSSSSRSSELANCRGLFTKQVAAVDWLGFPVTVSNVFLQLFPMIFCTCRC